MKSARSSVIQCNGDPPVVSEVLLITSLMNPDAKTGFGRIKSTGNLNMPGVTQGPGSVGYALQVLFKIASGNTRELEVERTILESHYQFAKGTEWSRSLKQGWRNDGPSAHEVQCGPNYIAVADAPGVENLVPVGGYKPKQSNQILPQSYPFEYYAKFQVNLRNGPHARILSMIQYDVRITTGHEEDMAVGAVTLLKRETQYTEPDFNRSLEEARASIHDLLYRTQRLADMSPSFKFRKK
jgi:hypothetical protein